MSSLTKYRVHEVAKDFKMTSKAIGEIMAEYTEPPKNHMHVLEDNELNVIFEYLTQNNQIESIEQVYAEVYHEPEPQPAAEQPAVEAAPAPQQPTAAPAATTQPAAQSPAPSQGQGTPAPAAAQKPAASAGQPAQKKTQPQVRIIDTRGGDVNLSRYDERIENMVPDSAANAGPGKQKIKRAPDKRQIAISSKRRAEEQEKIRRLQQAEMRKKIQLKVLIPDEIAVGELATRLKKTAAEVISRLMKLGVMATVNETIDFDTASLVALEFNAKVEHEVIVTIEERLIDDRQDKEEDLIQRDPVVVVMGHVDHGKTSLLDAIRQTEVAAGEAGGITQHIGAYRVGLGGREITFLDTPGHAAFTSMRARGAQVTDIAILVVAADDGIMPQTVEAINHAKAAEVPIIVAINKMDKEGADPERIKQQLTEYELVPEEWGGETIVVPVSAHTREGIEQLLEMVLLTADMQGLKANPSRAARGTVVEARLDRGRGPIATVLVQNGTLHQSDIIIAGKTVGRVRVMMDDRGNKLETAGPSVPVEIVGLSEVPEAGDQFNAVADERMARELVEQRKQQEREENARPTAQKVSLEDLFEQIQQGQVKDLNIIVKADVQGSVEAVRSSLEKISNEEVRVRVIHGAVGAISESDIMLASSSNAIIVGFNVRPDNAARDSAERNHVDMRLYRVIYDCIEEIEAAMKGMLAPNFHEVILGHAEVRQTYKASSVGTIAGCHVLDGKIQRGSSIRLVRDGVVVHEGELASLKRFKDDAREVSSGYDCGMSLERFNDIKEGDIFECFAIEEIKQ